jgi:hypothetical protein
MFSDPNIAGTVIRFAQHKALSALHHIPEGLHSQQLVVRDIDFVTARV